MTVYDRYDRVAVPYYGIPGFKLEKDVVLRRAELLTAGGINCNELRLDAVSVSLTSAKNMTRCSSRLVFIRLAIYRCLALALMEWFRHSIF